MIHFLTLLIATVVCYLYAMLAWKEYEWKQIKANNLQFIPFAFALIMWVLAHGVYWFAWFLLLIFA